jgi:hypothetical protein
VQLIANHHLDVPLESTIEKPTARAEKLISSETVKREIFRPQNPSPKPFGVTYHGQPPSEFTSTTEKITTLNYPQVHSFRHRYYPHNIQDVIGYGNRFNRPQEVAQDFTVKYHRNYKQSPSQYVPQNKRSTKNLTFNENDPFYLYKPQDPGDINLLATGNFRFAPPVWSNLKRNFPKAYSPQQQQYPTNRQEIYNHAKPLTVTLNIYPNNEKEVTGNQRYGLRQFINHRIENLQPRIKFPDNKPKKMTIHLNLYPGGASASETKLFSNAQTLPPTT